MPRIAIVNASGRRNVTNISIVGCSLADGTKKQILEYRIKGEDPLKTMTFPDYIRRRANFINLKHLNSK